MLSRLRPLFRQQFRRLATVLDLQKPQETTKDLPSLIFCGQGNKTGQVFTNQELQRRLSKLRAEMLENNVDVCLFTSYHNINYYSEFLYCYFGRSYGLVVTMDTETTISAGVDYGQPWRKGHCDNITYTDWERDNYFKAVRKLVGENKRVGLEFDHVNLGVMERIKNALPGVTFSDMGVPTMKLRLIKSDEEIALITNGARIADIGGGVQAMTLKENVPEYVVAMASTEAMNHEIAKTYPQADIMDTWSWIQSGINSDGAHNPNTTRKIQKGDIISANCFPMIAGYYMALERTMFLNHASKRALELWEINCKVHRRGIELIKPGVKCSEIAHELNEIYKVYDLLKYRTFGYGHSFGVLSHYYGREAGIELREDIDTVIEPNMVISMEPMITIPEGQPGAGGYKEHDIMIVTETGAEDITKFPFGPEHNII